MKPFSLLRSSQEAVLSCDPKFSKAMAPPKKNSKSKQSNNTSDKDDNVDEPTISELSQVLEKRARKRVSSSDSNVEPSTSTESTPSKVLRAPESLPQDLIQEMRSELQAMKKHGQDQHEEMLRIKARMSAKANSDFPWKKEGNRKQAEVMIKVLEFAHQAKVEYATKAPQKGERQLDGLITVANDRLKILKIADTSPYGWGTVSEFEASPIMENEEEDKRLRKAEKSAQEKQALKAQERKEKQSRYSNNPGGQYRNNYNNDSNRGESSYRSYGGFKNNNSFKQSTVVPDKPQPRRNTNNDICYNCGSRGHWANACPEKKPEDSTK